MDNENYTNIYGSNGGKEVKSDFDLSNVEEVTVNDKSYIKFIDPDTKEVRLMENLSKDSLELQFQKTADKYGIKLSSDAKENTNKVLDFKQKYESTPLGFIKITEMVNNYESFDKQLSALKPEQIKLLKYLIVNREELKIEKINLDNMIALDKNNEVIETKINPATLEISAGKAETKKMEYNNKSSFAPTQNTETINKSEEYTDEQYMEYPELLERQYRDGLITEEQKQAIEARLEQKKQETNALENSNQKKYVYQLTDDRKAGFLDTALFPGIIVALGFLIILTIIIVGTM